MAIRIDALRSAAARGRGTAARTLNEAKALGLKTVFLCHSHRDAGLVVGLERLLTDEGWRVYVDWQDAEMPESPNRETAARIQQKIVTLDYFLFLATQNSMASRWCPWEIGYADGKKALDQIFIVPTTDGLTTHGSEYLQLYRRIDISQQGPLGAWQPGQTSGLLLRDL